MSVASIDDFDFANIMNPPPTVVAAPIAEMALRAIETLFAEIEARATPTGRYTLFHAALIERESVMRLSEMAVTG